MEFYDQEVVQAIGWTLLHSLWQAVIWLLLALISVRIFRNESSKLKCNIYLGTAIGIFITSFITYQILLDASTNNVIVDAVHGSSIDNGSLNPDMQYSGAVSNTVLDQVEVFLFNNMSLFVCLWCLGLFILSIKFVYNIFLTHRIRNRSKAQLPDMWGEKILGMAKKMGITKKLAVYESSLVTVPSVIGFIKPIILIPLSTLTHLNEEQMKMVVLHELAHIKRNDFIVNLIQILLDIIYFFNPAFRFLSRKIRMERELACDALALDISTDVLSYAKTLVFLEDIRLRSGVETVMAITGTKNSLGYRVKRLLNQQDNLHYKSTNVFLIGICLLFLSGALFLNSCSYMKNDKTIEPLTLKKDVAQVSDTQGAIASDTISFDFIEKGFFSNTHYYVKFLDYKIVGLMIDDDEVEPQYYQNYQEKAVFQLKHYEDYIKKYNAYKARLAKNKAATLVLKEAMRNDGFFVTSGKHQRKSHCKISFRNNELFMNDQRQNQSMYAKYQKLAVIGHDFEKDDTLVVFE